VPAYKELGGNTMGSKAGRVFHNFASFCDGQLQDPDNHDDYMRIKKIREIRFIEVQELEKLLQSRDHKNREAIKRAHSDAKKWYKLDDEEFRRVQANREILILRCLENYLQAMRACEDFPNASLRVVSIWLDVSDNVRVNKTVEKFLGTVPSIKFAGLVNQLTSRLVDTEDEFGQTLMELLYRICTDHPYHSMYQLFAASKSKGGKGDDAADSRHRAATKLSDLLRQKSASGNVWIAVHNASIAFVRVAQVRLSDKAIKTGSKFLLRNISNGLPLVQAVEAQSRRMPPPTMRLALRPDCDYSSEPVMTEFEPHVTIAGGVSAPKIVTVRASDGSRNKMLLKGGNDDLRQDSIMEQVFEQVSNLLKDHRATRQRKLGIRTYKVIPLVTNAGIIEFVQDTKPLHDFLLPAHTQYFPKDFSPNKCRKAIADAQSKPLQQRVQAYRHVTQNFHPVMRFFFTEYFLDPDDWFYKRLNYSRSTAAISILGHVLGLGDRHGHNILLDTNTGEVVHIDLGVAFEAGRVLPVPEVVPFRLTRDLVDGMGISGVEGVFRRCCNFTLEALRRDKDDIMTILDVLRYDPLYSWSLSPVRLQRMQENAEAQAAVAANADTNATGTTDGAIAAAGMAAAGLGRKEVNEPSEADRALNVVLKKLGKSLSVEATVNELIRQATDERNLAVLYCGWQAYA
jgi:serine-protein kinase ATM